MQVRQTRLCSQEYTVSWADRDAGSGPTVELFTFDENVWVAVASEIC